MLIALLLWLVPLVHAADGALLVERAKAALTEERPEEARALALDAVRADPDDWTAYRVYLRAAAMGGVAERAEADFSELRTEDDTAAVVWAWWRVVEGELPLLELHRLADRVPREGAIALAWATARTDPEAAAALLPARSDDEMVARLALRLAVQGGRTRDARRAARDWLRAHPERPDILDELWPGEADGPLRRARRRALREIERGVTARDDDALYLHRALRVLSAAGAKEEAKAVADRLVALGQPGPLYRGTWNRAMRRAMGRTLALGTDPELPRGTRTELLDVVEALVEHALQRGRPDVALDGVTDLRERIGGWDAAALHLALLIDLERWDEALPVAEEALVGAAEPAWDDLSRLDTARQAHELAGALGARSEVRFHLGQRHEAVADAWLARLVEPQPRWDALWMRSLAALGPASGSHDPKARATALQEGREALARGDRDAARQAADAVLAEAARLDADGSSGTLAEAVGALRLRAEATGSLVDATLVTLLDPHDPAPYALRGRLQEAAGHRDAAFASYAIAAGLGLDTDAEMARVYDGLATPIPGAMAVVARWADALEVHEERLAALQADEDEDEAAPRGSNRPRVGRPMPGWRATSLAGERLDPEVLDGQVYVLALWASWCGPCLLELPEIDEIVGELAAEGLPVVGVAVSVDAAERTWRRAAERQGWQHLELGWEPTLTDALRVGSLPTTWVVGADGTVVYTQLGYEPSFAARLARVLRKHAE